MNIRRLTPADIDALAVYLDGLSPETRKRFGPHPFDRNTVVRLCTGAYESCFAYGAFEDDRMIGYAVVKPGSLDFERPRYARYPIRLDEHQDYTLAPSVADSHRSRGAGSALMTHIQDDLRARGASKIVLWGGVQLENQAAVRFYLKHGFRTLGEFEHNGTNLDMVRILHDRVSGDPDWLGDLIIYEINPYAFTSPEGAGDGGGSGTFRTLADKMPYLQDMGMNGLWIAGFSSSTRHFRGIPTVYACSDPAQLDPRLGGREDFEHLVECAHRHDLRVFLDVITHGVTNDSPLVTEHPDWFLGSSWGMTDFNYDHPDFRRWWIETWCAYVTDFGVDGFRLDGPNGANSDNSVLQIWDEIVERCGRQGREVLVFPENRRYHFQQGLDGQTHGGAPVPEPMLRHRFDSRAISNHDYGIDQPPDRSYYALQGSRYRLVFEYIFGPDIPILMAGEEFDAAYIALPSAEKDVFGGGGRSAWLYASWIHWDQLKEPQHRGFLDDFRRILQIRRNNNDILTYDRLKSNLRGLAIQGSTSEVPAPYLWAAASGGCIVVAGNPTSTTASVTFDLPVDEVFPGGTTEIHEIDLWTGVERRLPLEAWTAMTLEIPPDFTSGGGFRILRIEPIRSSES